MNLQIVDILKHGFSARTTSFRLRKALPVALLSAVLGIGTTTAAAGPEDGWPSKPLKIVIPFPPGGAADTIGRLLAVELSESLGQPVVPENRPGAGTAIAAEAVARAQPDGYTLSLASAGQLTVLPLLHEKLNFDPVKSFAPVALAAEVPYIVSVGPGTSAATLSELLEQARSSSEGFNYSSCGNGTVCHLTGELLNTLADAKLQHVPFSGSAPAITAVLGGHVQVAVDTAAVQAPHIRSGKLRPLVITSEKRSPALPEVPSAAEVGLPSFVSSSWFGVVVPAGTPEPIIARLNAEIGKALESERTRERFSTLGLSALGGTPEQLADLVQADLQKWKTVVDRAGVKAH